MTVLTELNTKLYESTGVDVFERDTYSGLTSTELDFCALSHNNIFTSMEKRNATYKFFLSSIGLSEYQVAIPIQVHRSVIQEIRYHEIKGNEFFLQECDGLYTFDEKVMLGVTVADCAGVLFYSPSNDLIAVVHSGWRGTVGMERSIDITREGGIVASFLNLCEHNYGILPSDFYVWISPSAKSCCYEVGENVAELFLRHKNSVRKEAGSFYVDLSEYIYGDLLDLGVNEECITRNDQCSICDKNFHSFRRDGDESGRGLVFIAKR